LPAPNTGTHSLAGRLQLEQVTIRCEFTTGGIILTNTDYRYGQPAQSERNILDYVPNLAAMVQQRSGELREVVERFSCDRDALLRFYDVPGSPLQLARQPVPHPAAAGLPEQLEVLR